MNNLQLNILSYGGSFSNQRDYREVMEEKKMMRKIDLGPLHSRISEHLDNWDKSKDEIDILWNGIYDPTGRINRTLILSSNEEKISFARTLIDWWQFIDWHCVENYKEGHQGLTELFGDKFDSRNPGIMGSLGKDRFTIWQYVPHRIDNYGDQLSGNKEAKLLEAKGPLEKLSELPKSLFPDFTEIKLPNNVNLFMRFRDYWR